MPGLLISVRYDPFLDAAGLADIKWNTVQSVSLFPETHAQYAVWAVSDITRKPCWSSALASSGELWIRNKEACCDTDLHSSTGALCGTTQTNYFNSPNKSFCGLTGREVVIQEMHSGERETRDGYISPPPVTPEHSPLRCSVPKAPKSIVATWQNRAVTFMSALRTVSLSLSSLSFSLSIHLASIHLPHSSIHPFLSTLSSECWTDCEAPWSNKMDLTSSSLSSLHPLAAWTALCSAHALHHLALASCAFVFGQHETIRSVLNAASHWASHWFLLTQAGVQPPAQMSHCLHRPFKSACISWAGESKLIAFEQAVWIQPVFTDTPISTEQSEKCGFLYSLSVSSNLKSSFCSIVLIDSMCVAVSTGQTMFIFVLATWRVLSSSWNEEGSWFKGSSGGSGCCWMVGGCCRIEVTITAISRGSTGD